MSFRFRDFPQLKFNCPGIFFEEGSSFVEDKHCMFLKTSLISYSFEEKNYVKACKLQRRWRFRTHFNSGLGRPRDLRSMILASLFAWFVLLINERKNKAFSKLQPPLNIFLALILILSPSIFCFRCSSVTHPFGLSSLIPNSTPLILVYWKMGRK